MSRKRNHDRADELGRRQVLPAQVAFGVLLGGGGVMVTVLGYSFAVRRSDPERRAL